MAEVECELYLDGEPRPGPDGGGPDGAGPDGGGPDGAGPDGGGPDGAGPDGADSYDAALAEAREHGGFVWLSLTRPDADAFDRIAATFGLHELAVEDAVKSGQRPKIERYGDVVFAALRTARYLEHDALTATSEIIETGDLMLFVGPEFVITVQHGAAGDLQPVRTHLRRRRDLLRHGPWAVAYMVYDRVVDGYLDVAAAVEDDIDVVEENVFAPAGAAQLGRIQQIYQLKRELLEFRRAVVPLQRPLGDLVSATAVEVPKEVRKYFRDVNDHLTRAAEQAMYFDDLLNSILQARLAQISVDQNNDMRKIAAWAAIAAVWTSIAGVYGMNFRYMPELGWVLGYPAVLLLMAAVSLWLHRAFRRSGWL